MKKRVFSALLTVFLLLQMIPVAFAASANYKVYVLYSYTQKAGKDKQESFTKEDSSNNAYDSVADVLTDLQDGKLAGKNKTQFTVDTTQPMTICIKQSTGVYTEEISSKVIVSAEESGEESGEESTGEICVVYPGVITIQTVYSGTYVHSDNALTFAGGLEIQNGASLVLAQNSTSDSSGSTINYVFNNDVTVGGSLAFSGNTTRLGGGGTSGSTTFSNGATLTVEDGGKVTIGSVEVTAEDDEESDSEALIMVESGGTLTMQSDGLSSYGSISTSGTAIVVEEDGELTVSAGEITSSSGSAIEVEDGGTISIQETKTSLTSPSVLSPSITTEETNKQAVSLESGATVKKGDDITVTVDSDDEGAVSYVDNYGNIILYATSSEDEDGKVTASRIITADGTDIQVSEDSEELLIIAYSEESDETTTLVTVPAGASVDGEEWSAGGSVESDGDEPTTKPNVSGVTLSDANLNLVCDGANNTATLTATITPEGAEGTISWSSSDEDVATVNNGTVTAVGVGTATITVTVTDSDGEVLATATREVNVTKTPVPATSITIDPDSTTIYVGRTEQLKANLEPSNSTDTITWSSSDESVATVDAQGVVTAIKKGTATITATANDSVSASCEVTVKKKSSSSSSSSSSSYSVSTPSKVENGTVKVSPAKAEKGDTVTITVTPDKGYEVDEVVVTDKNGKELSVKDKGNGKFTFTMPASKVEIEATFVPERDKTIVLTIGSVEATVFDTPVINDVAPVARNNRTMLPIRFVAEALGARVDWDANQQKVTIVRDTLVIEIFLNSDVAFVNGQPVQLDAPAFAENNRTYLPLRFVAENLGAVVEWDSATQTVTIIP